MAALMREERCVSVGARDRTARLWKVVEETQLVFRGGGSSSEKKRPPRKDDQTISSSESSKSYNEGSIDRVAVIDEETFVTGSDNGSLSLWSLQKKKPVFTIALAHGLDPALKPEEISADVVPTNVNIPDRQPRWITALATIPLSDLVVSGSWDGAIRAWRVSADRKRLEQVGVVGKVDEKGGEVEVDKENGDANGNGDDGAEVGKGASSIEGFVNDLCVIERGDQGKNGVAIVAALGTEHRLGRWKSVEGKNGAVICEIPKKGTTAENSVGDGMEEAEKET